MRGNNIPNKGHVRELQPEVTHTSDFSKLDNLSDSFETYLENAPYAIYFIDLEGYLLYCNKQAEEITGFTKKELSGQNFFKTHLVSGAYPAKFTAILALSAAGKSPPSSEFELRRKDGTLKLVEVSTTPVEKEGKTVVIAFMRDVSERQHAEAQIISQSKFPSENPNPVIRVNRECIILFHNKASMPLLRYWQTEIGKPLPKDWCRLVESVYKNGIGKTAEAKCEDKVYLLNVVPIKDNDYVNIYAMEITDLKSAETQVQHLNQVLLTIRKVNQIIVATDDEKELLQKTCEAIVDGRNYHLARIGLTVAGTFDIEWAAHQSLKKDFPPDIKVTWDDSEYGQGPVGKAIKTGRTVVIGDATTDESFRPWRDRAIKDGIVSLCALPLVVRNKTIGALGVYSDKKDAFSNDEIELLQELAGDISLGIQKIRQQNEIRQAQEKYSTLVENSNDGIIILQNGKLKFASPQMDKMSGFLPEEYLDKPFINYIAPEYRESIIEMYKQRLISQEVPRRYEIEIITKDSKSLPMEISISFIEYEGRPAEMGIVRDVSERKQAEEKLRESEERLRAIVTNAPIGIATTGTDRLFLSANNAFCKILGYSESELQKMSFKDITHPEDLGDSIAYMANLDANKISGFHQEKRYIKKDGTVIFGNITVNTVRNPEGSLLLYIAELEDITERKRAEEALRESEQRFREMFDKHLAVMLLIEPQSGRIVDANAAAAEYYGYPRETLRNMNITEINQLPPDEVAEARQTAAKKQENYFIFSHRLASGEIRKVEIYSSPIKIGAQTFLFSIIHDITERKQAEEALRISEENFRRSIEESPFGIRIVSAEGKSLYANRALLDIWGYNTLEELEATPPRERFTPEEYLVYEQRAARQQKGEVIPANVVVSIKRKNGEVRHLSAYRKEVLWNGSRQFQVILQDITESKQAEEKIKESEERLKEAQALGKIGSYEVDYVTWDVIWSDEMYELFERDKNLPPPTGEELANYFSPEEFAKFAELRRIAIEEGKESHRDIITKLPSGKTPIFLISLRPVKGDKGKVVKMFGIIQDVTERKQAEEELKFRSQLLDAATDAILVLDNKNNIVYFNEAVCRSRGYDREEMNGKKLLDIIAPEYISLISSQVNKELGEKGEAIFESIELCKDNSITPVEIHSRIIKLGGQEYIVNISRDITQRKQADNELKQSYEKLQKTLDGIITAMAATIEIRDPYTAGHQRQTAHLVHAIAQEMGLPKEQLNGIYTAGLIHDIGKVGIPADILSKPGELSEVEFSLIKAHSQIGYDVLKNIDFPYPVAQWILQHHERLNGSGYPAGLRGDKISLEAKILAVADVVDAMASHRPYRVALGVEAALDEITKQKDILYYGAAVDACVRLFKKKGYKLEYNWDKNKNLWEPENSPDPNQTTQ